MVRITEETSELILEKRILNIILVTKDKLARKVSQLEKQIENHDVILAHLVKEVRHLIEARQPKTKKPLKLTK